jgi:mRNA-capping enzyme
MQAQQLHHRKVNNSQVNFLFNKDLDDGKPQFMDGQVQLVKLLEDKELQNYLRGTIKEYCNFKRDVFPGSQPVSLEQSPEQNNLRFLAEHDYMVSWKADGMRYLVLIKDEDQIYAFDRDNNVFELNGISFPHRKHDRHVRNTLVDAEMIIEHIPELNGQPARIRPRLLIYDIVKFEVRFKSI